MSDTTTPPAPSGARIAAIDVGSNSVRLVVAEVLTSGGYRVLDEERENTRLAALDGQHRRTLRSCDRRHDYGAPPLPVDRDRLWRRPDFGDCDQRRPRRRERPRVLPSASTASSTSTWK